MRLKIALPNGSLRENTLTLFEKMGCPLTIRGVKGRPINSKWTMKIEVKFFRPRQVIYAVKSGVYHMGIVGEDWLIEDGWELGQRDYEPITVLPYTLEYTKSGFGKRCRLCLETVPKWSGRYAQTQNLRIATEYYKIAKGVVRNKRWPESTEIILTDGSSEAFVPELADIALDIVDTGDTVRGSGLIIKEEIMKVGVRVIARLYPWYWDLSKFIGDLGVAARALGALPK